MLVSQVVLVRRTVPTGRAGMAGPSARGRPACVNDWPRWTAHWTRAWPPRAFSSSRRRCRSLRRNDDHTPVRVLLADDEHLIRGAPAALLALEDGLVVVAEAAASGTEALAMARAHRPDVAVLDLQMPGPDGVSVATSLRAELPECRTVIVTGNGLPGHLKRALVAGVRGFAPKTVSAQRPAEIIRTVHAGNRYVDPELAADAISAGDSPPTVREAQVLEPAADGSPSRRSRRRPRCRRGRYGTTSRRPRPAGGREPTHGGTSRTRARLGIVVPALQRMRT